MIELSKAFCNPSIERGLLIRDVTYHPLKDDLSSGLLYDYILE